MDLIKLKIPATFASGKAVLSWRDLRFGIVCELLDPQAAIEFAIEQLGSEDEPAPALLELASAGRGEPVMPWVDQLAAAEAPCDEVLIRDKWLHIVLAWLYEHRAELSDPLQTVEEVYADFDYPEQIASFVRYMPMQGPDLGSRLANERRLFERWKVFVENWRTKGARPTKDVL